MIFQKNRFLMCRTYKAWMIICWIERTFVAPFFLVRKIATFLLIQVSLTMNWMHFVHQLFLSIARTCCSSLEHSSMCPLIPQAEVNPSLCFLVLCIWAQLRLCHSHSWTSWAAKLLCIDLCILHASDGSVFIGSNKCLSKGSWIMLIHIFIQQHTSNVLYVGNRVGIILDPGDTAVTRTNTALTLISLMIQKKRHALIQVITITDDEGYDRKHRILL